MGDEYRPHHLHGTKLSADGAPVLDLRNINLRTTKVHFEIPATKMEPASITPKEKSEGEEN